MKKAHSSALALAMVIALSLPARASTQDDLDNLDYGVKSGLLTSIIATAVCACTFVEHISSTECLNRLNVLPEATLLTDIVTNDLNKTVTVSPNAFALGYAKGKVPRAVARYERKDPRFGCTLIEAGGSDHLSRLE